MQIKTLEYANPWRGENGTDLPATFRRVDRPVYDSPCGRGQLVKVHDTQYDYLIHGIVVTQRVGKSMDLLIAMIAATLDGTEPSEDNNHYAQLQAAEWYHKQENTK